MKKIIVTDPCYLIADEDWNIAIEKADKKTKDNEAWAKCFDEVIAPSPEGKGAMTS